MKNITKLALICFFLFLAQNAVSDPNIGKKQEPLTGLGSGIWENKNIPVCFENPVNSNVKERKWVREATRETWERYSAIRFKNWGKCNKNSKGIRIKIADDGPHTKGLGTQLNGKKNGMLLNFTFNKWSTSCKNSLKYCIKTIAVHEFGHALSFSHEQNRPDAPYECRKENSQGTTGDILITKYDLKSVMNYCNPQWSGNGKLSKLDIKGLVKWYSSVPRKGVLNVMGLCLDVAGGINSNRTNIQIFECNNTKSQQWVFNSRNEIRNVMGRCLEVAGGVNKNRTNVQLFDCNDTKSQKWFYNSRKEIRNAMGRCLEIAGGVNSNRTNIQIYDCNNTASQKWRK